MYSPRYSPRDNPYDLLLNASPTTGFPSMHSFPLASARVRQFVCSSWVLVSRRSSEVQNGLILSAREESVRFGHLVAVFSLCAETPGSSANACDHGAHNHGVGLPVGRLAVPTTGRRPDVLWVPKDVRDTEITPIELPTYGIFPPPPMLKCVCA